MYKTKVFFTCSHSGKKKYQEYYDKIVSAIENSNVNLIATELGNYKQTLTKADLKKCKSDREVHYLAIKKGIQWADLIILELSEESFQVGHEATLAMEMKKPVLGLSLNEDWAARIKHPYFHAAKYTKYFYKDIIEKFIRDFGDEQLSERFNLFLSKRQLNKLERKAKDENINMSEMIRRLVDGK